jgi:hypothetical protein
MKNILLPDTYIVRSRYLTHWSYRSTWYVIVAGLIINGSMYFAWQKMNETKALREEVAEALSKNELELSKKKAETEPLIAKFKELVRWQSIGRIPLAPVLDAIEKAMQTEINTGLTSLKWELREVKEGAKKGTLTMTVFLSQSGGTSLTESSLWLDSVKKTLTYNKLKYGKFFVSEGRTADGGVLFDVSFDLEDSRG